jgi:hypothetical protein
MLGQSELCSVVPPRGLRVVGVFKKELQLESYLLCFRAGGWLCKRMSLYRKLFRKKDFGLLHFLADLERGCEWLQPLVTLPG